MFGRNGTIGATELDAERRWDGANDGNRGFARLQSIDSFYIYAHNIKDFLIIFFLFTVSVNNLSFSFASDCVD